MSAPTSQTDRSLIASLLVKPAKLDHVRGLGVTRDHFRDEFAAECWDAIVSLHDGEEVVDSATVAARIRHSSVLDNPDLEVARLGSTLPTGEAADVFAKELVRRRASDSLLACTNLLRSQLMRARDPVESLGKFHESVNELGTMPSGVVHAKALVESSLANIREGKKFWPTGWRAVDDVLGGLQPKKTTVVAARPSMGKTAFATNIGVRAATKGFRVLFVTLEMTPEEVFTNMVTAYCGIPALKNLDAHDSMRLNEGFAEVSQFDIRFIDAVGQTCSEIMAQVMPIVRAGEVDLVIFDYLQRVSIGDEDERRAIARASKAFTDEVARHGPAVLLLAQLNRKVEDRKNKRPQMSDLQGSGSIEQDAQQIIFIYRPEYYLEREFGTNWRDMPEHAALAENTPSGVTEILVNKNRGWKTGQALLHWRPEIQQFSNMQKRFAS